MPITLPILDDRRFDDLVAEGRALIPALAPQWTDHNPADPGITLIELFAYLTEVLMYRLDIVTEANTRAFLALLDAGYVQTPDLAQDVRNVVLALRTPDRAVTPEDFVLLAHQASPDVARAGVVVDRDLGRSATEPAPGHISVVIVPRPGANADDVLPLVFARLDQGRLLTTRLHVAKPAVVPFELRLNLVIEADARADDVKKRATAALTAWLDPLAGGPDGSGWPFGRPVYLSEIYALLDALPGIDWVEPGPEAEFKVDPPDRVPIVDGAQVAVNLAPDELPANDAAQFILTPLLADGRTP